jgi:hypothetical protein
MIPGSNILLGVTGGVAAFKAADLVRRLKERGHNVRCAMTRSAEAFVTPLTLEVLSGHSVYREEYLQPDNQGEELHISAAGWADVLCVAPVTAHTLRLPDHHGAGLFGSGRVGSGHAHRDVAKGFGSGPPGCVEESGCSLRGAG